jgi:LysM repeat protein
MRNGTSWIFGIIVAIAAFHMYTRRVDTGDLKKGAADPEALAKAPAPKGEGIALATEGAAAATPPAAPAPAARSTEPPAATAAKAASATEATGEATTVEGAAAQASALHRDGLEALMAGDEVKAALLLYRCSRARTQSADRDDAAARLAGIEKGAIERAAKAKSAGAGLDERAALSAAYFAALDAKKRDGYRTRLDELVAEYIFSTRPVECADMHTVAKGDSLQKIAAKYNFPVEGIQKVNKLSTTSLRIGERLKVPRGPVEVLVVKSEFRLVLLLGGLYLKEYQVGTGREGCTPEATFTIEDKIKEPTWHSKEGVFPFGHPKNILGTRWLAFRNTDDYKGFGIHGTAFPNSIGTEASSGCIRMRNADVEELFGLVPKGASVTITR